MSPLVISLALVLASGGAVETAGEEAAGGVAQERHGEVTSGGSFYVEWWPEPVPVPLNEMFEIRLRVFEATDRSELVGGAALTAEAWMPDHNHGSPLDPRIEAHGDGTFTGRGFLLQMEGRWELRIGVAAEGRMERAVFEIDLEP